MVQVEQFRIASNPLPLAAALQLLDGLLHPGVVLEPKSISARATLVEGVCMELLDAIHDEAVGDRVKVAGLRRPLALRHCTVITVDELHSFRDDLRGAGRCSDQLFALLSWRYRFTNRTLDSDDSIQIVGRPHI